MNGHLDESTMLDLALGESRDAAAESHLAVCDRCRDQVSLLREGLSLARDGAPTMPDLAQRPFTYAFFQRRLWSRRLIQLSAAALLLLSLLGFSFRSGPTGLEVQFSVLGLNRGQSMAQVQKLEQRLEATQARLSEAMDLQAAVAQEQFQQRLNAFYLERAQELQEFTNQVEDNIRFIEFNNRQAIAAVQLEMREALNRNELKEQTP